MPTRLRPDSTAMRFDLLIASALAAVSIVLIALSIGSGLMPDAPLWQPILASLALVAPLVVRRWWPVPAMLVQVVVYIVGIELQLIEFYASQVTLFLGMYAVGAWEAHRRKAFWSRVVVVVVMAGWLLIAVVRDLDRPEVVADRSGYLAYIGIQVVVNIAFFAGAWVFGDRSWRATLAREELDHAYREITEAQARLAQQEVTLERVRIARELHDVVAHHVSAMGVQAGAARRVLPRSPEQAEEALRAVEQSARDAIGELRTIVGALRSDDGADDTPAPTIEDLPGLLESARAAGQHVAFQSVGQPRALSPVTGLTLYRVVQEALTNVRKHGGPTARADVRLRYDGDRVEAEVADDGPGSTPSAGSGLGLVGMRERITALGGDLHAGPRSRGGWLVRASVPAPATEKTR